MRAVIASVALVAVLIAGQWAPVCAGGVRSVDNASAQEVVDGMAGKFGRGVANVATGWAEFPKQIYVTWSEDGAGRGLLIGSPQGGRDDPGADSGRGRRSGDLLSCLARLL